MSASRATTGCGDRAVRGFCEYHGRTSGDCGSCSHWAPCLSRAGRVIHQHEMRGAGDTMGRRTGMPCTRIQGASWLQQSGKRVREQRGTSERVKNRCVHCHNNCMQQQEEAVLRTLIVPPPDVECVTSTLKGNGPWTGAKPSATGSPTCVRPGVATA